MFFPRWLPQCQLVPFRQHGGQDQRRQVHRHRGRHHEEGLAILAHRRPAGTRHVAQEVAGAYKIFFTIFNKLVFKKSI